MNMNIDWKILGKVSLKVFGSLAAAAGFFVLLNVSIELIGGWTLLFFPAIVIYYVIKFLYEDEMIRQGKPLKRKV